MEGIENSYSAGSPHLDLSYDKALHSRWGGINFRTAENVCFASQDQLLLDYRSSLKEHKISGSLLYAWTNGTHSGEATSDGTPNGEGTAALFGGKMNYSGNFKQGLIHGQGKLVFSTGLMYEGQFFYNCIHGAGTYHWHDGGTYSGEVMDGVPNGTGVMHTGKHRWCTYTGTWLKGLRHGKGTLNYGKQGETFYYGQWEGDCKHGEGNLVYKSGSTYRGSWFDGKRQGLGHAVLVTESVIKKPDAALMHMHWRLDAKAVQIYEGKWQNNLPHGSGIDVWADDGVEEEPNILRNTYSGNFFEGKRSGHGIFYYATGAIFHGTWDANVKEGSGTLVYEDGMVHNGAFSRDRFSVSMLSTDKEPLDILVEVDSNTSSTRRKVVDIFKRYNSKLRTIFNLYSYFPKKPLDERNPSYLGRTRALLLEQLWQFCHDIKVVHPHFGLAQIDVMMRASLFSWDCHSDIHFPRKKFLYREFLEAIIKLARRKYKEDAPLDVKVSNFLEAGVLDCEATERESMYVLVSSSPIQSIFGDYKSEMHRLLYVTLREVGTSDGTIKILHLLSFFTRFGPDLVVDQTSVVEKIIKELYYKSITEDDDSNDFMDCNINFRECELCILIIALEDKTIPKAEPQQLLLKTLVEIVVPNLSASLDALLNETPPPSKKGKKKV